MNAYTHKALYETRIQDWNREARQAREAAAKEKKSPSKLTLIVTVISQVLRIN